MGTTAIEVDNLRKSFANETVLKDIDLEIEEGEFCVVIGPSGCGKSTLLDSIAGLTEFDAGSISFEGTDISTVPVEERDVGYVFQEFENTLFPHMTVAENIAFGLQQQGVDDAEIEEITDDMLDLLAISDTRDSPPNELSGGQQQRVELARQLVRRCRLMLLDDPLADLDYKLQKRMELEIRRLHNELESTFVYVTHNQDQALKLADTIVVMNQGMIEQVGPPETVYENPATAFVGRFVGDTNLFSGPVASIDGDTTAVDTDLGQMTAALASGEYEADRNAVVLVRPSDIEIGEAADGLDNTVRVTLAGSTYTGERTEFAMTPLESDDERDIQVVKTGDPYVGEVGDELTIGWTTDAAMGFQELSVTDTVTIGDLREV